MDTERETNKFEKKLLAELMKKRGRSCFKKKMFMADQLYKLSSLSIYLCLILVVFWYYVTYCLLFRISTPVAFLLSIHTL